VSPAATMPRFELEVNGRGLDARNVVTAVSVVREPDTLDELVLSLADEPPGLPLISEGALPATPGDTVVLQLGYQNDMVRVFEGEVTSLGVRFPSEAAPTVEIRAHSRLHRLLRGTRTRAYQNVTDAGMAQKIAQEAGLTARATATKVTYDHVLQYNQTDLAFLRDRARRLGYVVSVDGMTLVFGPPTAARAPTHRFEVGGGELIDLSLTVDALQQNSSVEVHGRDAKSHAPVVGLASALSRSMGQTPATGVAAKLSGPRAQEVVLEPLAMSKQEADERARGRLETGALGFVRGVGTVVGTPGLRAGTLIRLGGIGPWLDGDYYVAQVAHTFDLNGFETRFSVRRNGWR